MTRDALAGAFYLPSWPGETPCRRAQLSLVTPLRWPGCGQSQLGPAAGDTNEVGEGTRSCSQLFMGPKTPTAAAEGPGLTSPRSPGGRQQRDAPCVPTAPPGTGGPHGLFHENILRGRAAITCVKPRVPCRSRRSPAARVRDAAMARCADSSCVPTACSSTPRSCTRAPTCAISACCEVTGPIGSVRASPSPGGRIRQGYKQEP